MTKDWEFDAISSAFAPMPLSVACRNASLRATIGPGPSEGSACRFSLPAWQSWASARQATPMSSRQRAASARCRACSLTASRCTSPATSSPGSSRTHNNPRAPSVHPIRHHERSNARKAAPLFQLGRLICSLRLPMLLKYRREQLQRHQISYELSHQRLQ